MAKTITFQRTLSPAESMLGVFLALLIPVLSAGISIPTLTASILSGI